MEIHMSRKVIINCAVTGAIHVPSLSPYLPITPAQIAAEAVAAAEAGAATVHLHARDPQNGRPDMEPELASINMGSINFGLYPMMARIKEYKYDWEKHGRQALRR
jgi:hypothetical protein